MRRCGTADVVKGREEGKGKGRGGAVPPCQRAQCR